MQRILLVEDNEMNRDLISRRLGRRGFEVSIAVDGAEGVEKATSDLPDLIVMDMGLPVLDGYEATRLLKEAEATRRIPIIGLSAHAMSGDARKALKAGCDDYDTKPMDWKRLQGKIDALLARVQEDAAAKDAGETTVVEGISEPAAHLLVVDDNAMHRELLSSRLASLGYTYDLAADGPGALEQLQRTPYDAVLLDVTLPSLEGQPLLEKIRSDARWQDLPILMLSTIDAMRDAIACLPQGAEDLVPQPFHKEVLAARLDSCLERHRLRERENRLAEELSTERRRAQYLLGNILPGELVKELEETGKIMPRRCSDVAVLFCDVAGFSQLSDELDPLDAVRRLQRLIVAFEENAARHGLEKIKTVGDSFMATAGLFEPSPDAPLAAVRCALEMRQTAVGLESDWQLRIGIHLGPVVAGVVGHGKYQLDLWGATVQTAARVKGAGTAGAVQVSEAVWQKVAEHCGGQRLGEAKLRGGGTVTVHQVDRVGA